VERMAGRIVAMVDGRLAAVGSVAHLRAAMTDRPRQFRVVADDPRRLARRLVAVEAVSGIRLRGDVIEIEADDASALARELPRSAGRAAQGEAVRRVARERVPVAGGEALSVLALFRHHVGMLFRRGRLFLVTLLAVTPAGVLLIGGLADDEPPTEIAGLVANI